MVEFNSTTSFKKQLQIISETGVFISVHTSNLANAQFLPPGAAVIELIQRNWIWHNLDKSFQVGGCQGLRGSRLQCAGGVHGARDACHGCCMVLGRSWLLQVRQQVQLGVAHSQQVDAGRWQNSCLCHLLQGAGRNKICQGLCEQLRGVERGLQSQAQPTSAAAGCFTTKLQVYASSACMG